jgi:hypothetical protein
LDSGVDLQIGASDCVWQANATEITAAAWSDSAPYSISSIVEPAASLPV